MPLRIVAPEPAQAPRDAAGTDEEDGAQTRSTDAPEPSRAPVQETVADVADVADVAGGLLGRR